MRREKAAAEAAAPVASGLAPDALNFGYIISGDEPAWRPLRVFDDGRQTFLEFPATLAQGEAPPPHSTGLASAMRDGEIVLAKLMNPSISCGHRVVDGWDAASFVQALERLAETPALLFAP